MTKRNLKYTSLRRKDTIKSKWIDPFGEEHITYYGRKKISTNLTTWNPNRVQVKDE